MNLFCRLPCSLQLHGPPRGFSKLIEPVIQIGIDAGGTIKHQHELSPSRLERACLVPWQARPLNRRTALTQKPRCRAGSLGAEIAFPFHRAYEAVDEAAMIPPAPIITFLREILISKSSLPHFPQRHEFAETSMSWCSVRFEPISGKANAMVSRRKEAGVPRAKRLPSSPQDSVASRCAPQ